MTSFQPTPEAAPDGSGNRPDRPRPAPITVTKPKDRHAEVGFRGRQRSNATQASIADPKARLYRTSPGTGARLSFTGLPPMESRTGLIVGTGMPQTDGHAKRRAALGYAPPPIAMPAASRMIPHRHMTVEPASENAAKIVNGWGRLANAPRRRVRTTAPVQAIRQRYGQRVLWMGGDKPSRRTGLRSGMITHDTSVPWQTMPWDFLQYPSLLARRLIVSGMENATVIGRRVVIVKHGRKGYQEQR